MQSQLAEEISLEVWQDPQGEVVLHSSDRKTCIYFGCWDEKGDPAGYLAKIIFEHCCATKFVHSSYPPYEVTGERSRSAILNVFDSQWLRALVERKKELHPNLINPQEAYNGKLYKHFVVLGHDVYVDVIATGFRIEKIDRCCAGELVYLIDNA